MGPTTIRAADGTELDAGVVNLAKAIRARESKGDYNAVGDAGTSKGAYQWQPGNFENGAKKYGLDPKDFSPVNQDKVAYYQVKELKDKGYTPEQVAAAWNAGEGSLKNDRWKSLVGTTTINGQQIHYDTPGYVNEVVRHFQEIKGGYNPTPYSNPSVQNNPGAINFSGQTNAQTPQGPEQTPPSIMPNVGEIGTELSTNITNRLKDFSDAGTTAMQGGPGALMHVGSGLLQGAGAVAGGVGDVVNAGLQLIPGVQGAEKMLEGGVKGVLETQTGKDIVSAFSKFSQENPEISKDIGAGINVLAAIPLLRGLGLVKTAVMDASTAAFKKTVLKEAEAEIKENLTSRPAAELARAAKRGADPIPMLLENPTYLPEVVANPSGGFMYSSKKGESLIQTSLDADEAALQAKFDTAITNKNMMVSITNTEKQVLKDIKRDYPLSANYLPAVRAINDVFESWRASAGGRDMISLNELNGLKRDVRSAVFDVKGDVKGTASAQIKYDIGQSLMDQVETIAKKAGIDGVPEINKEMARKINALKVLDAMDGRKVATKGGMGREVAVDVAGAAGEAAGNAVGIPFAGTLASRGLVGKVLRTNPRTAISKLSSYKGNPIKTVRRGLVQLGKGVGLQSTQQ